MQAILNKITAFVTCPGPDGPQLLLFEHPYAGVQIPAGTVEPGEVPEAAARREVREETGLVDLLLAATIGVQITRLPEGTFVILESSPVYARPDPNSFDWARLRRGIQVRLERQAGDFAQVTYLEGNKYPDPDYISYQITGWLPRQALASASRRHFYHFIYLGAPTAPTWEINADKHNFRPFWVPLSVLLAEKPAEQPTTVSALNALIISPQRAWLETAIWKFGYDFEDRSH